MNGKLLVFLLALPALCSAAGEISLSCDLAVMTLDASGRIVSLTERGSGRELLAKPTPFVGMGETATGRYTGSNFCEKNGELLRFRFPENGGEFQKVEIEIPVTQYKDGESWYSGGFEANADVTMLKK